MFNASQVLPPATHGVEHHLVTSGPPIASKFRRLDGKKLAAARSEFAKMEKDGIVRRSTSPWSSPLHMVLKADGSWQPCGDFRRLNLVTEPDTYPLPNMLDFASKVAGCKIFSKVDLRKGYHQIPMHSVDVPKTAVATPFGWFEFLCLPFGLRNAGSTFQSLMDRVLCGLPWCFWYLDDIIVASASREEHLVHLQQLFERLRQHNLVINAEKCVFGVTKVEFLGHEVTAQGARPLKSHVTALQNHPPPTNIQQLQAFLGLVNFYHRFVKGAAKLLKPLSNCLRGGKSSKDPVDQSAEFLAAIEAAKQAVAEAALLAHPISGAEICLMVDASNVHVGASLQQRTSSSAPWQPLGFFSKKLEAAQQRYRELWACFAGIRHFRFMLEERRFIIFTDHKPLTFALRRSSDPWTARQCRQLSYIAEYTSDIRHIASKDNIVADTLSRPPQLLPIPQRTNVRPGLAEHKPAGVNAPPGSLAAAIPAGVSQVTGNSSVGQLLDYAQIAANQKICPETAALVDNSSLQLQPVEIGGVSLLCDWSTGTPRPLIPAADRQAVFAAIHGLAHPGVRATRRLLATRAVWPNMKADAGRWCRDCQYCSRGKSSSQPTAAIQPIPVPHQRFSHIHVDLVGPLPVSAAGYSYLFTIIDRSSRWVETVPLKTMDAASCTDALVLAWISRFGVLGQLRRTVAHNSAQSCGASCVAGWVSAAPPPQRTIHRPLAWSRGLTVS